MITLFLFLAISASGGSIELAADSKWDPEERCTASLLIPPAPFQGTHVPIQDFKRQYSIESTNTTPFCDCVLIGDLAEGEWERSKLATYTFSSPVWLWGPIMVLGKGELISRTVVSDGHGKARSISLESRAKLMNIR